MTGPRPSAIGVIRADISGDGEDRDRYTIEELAERWGYALPLVLSIGVGTLELEPMALITVSILTFDAVAVIAPNQNHIWAHRRGITAACDLIVATPGDEMTWKRGHQWPLPTPEQSIAGVAPCWRPAGPTRAPRNGAPRMEG